MAHPSGLVGAASRDPGREPAAPGASLHVVTADVPTREDPDRAVDDQPGRSVPTTWEEVARDYGPMLYGVAYRLTGNESDARDLVQDTLIKIDRALHTFQPGSFSRWVYRILHNTFLDQARRRQRIRMQPLPDDVSRFAHGESAPDPETALAEYRIDDDIQEAIDALPPEFKAAVVMCDIVGLGYQEIADQTGVAVGTVRSRIHRGRAQLRERLAHRLEEDLT